MKDPCGSNKLNILAREAKGWGIISQLINILEKTSVGKHFFKIALLLRDSIFLSSILTNCEVCYGLTKADIEKLENLDKTLLRRIFAVPNSTPITALYLESGTMRIRTIIKARRLKFLHYLVKLPKRNMLSNFFHAQWEHSTKLDLTEQVKRAQKNVQKFPTADELSMKMLGFLYVLEQFRMMIQLPLLSCVQQSSQECLGGYQMCSLGHQRAQHLVQT